MSEITTGRVIFGPDNATPAVTFVSLCHSKLPFLTPILAASAHRAFIRKVGDGIGMNAVYRVCLSASRRQERSLATPPAPAAPETEGICKLISKPTLKIRSERL